MTTQETTSASENTKARKRGLSVVPFEDRMLDQVLDLYAAVFGAAAADGYSRRWEWSQKTNMFPDKTRRWVLLTADDEVKGFLGTIPFAYNINGKQEIAHTTCDFMVDPDTRFHGIKLMKQFFKECENSISADDMQATIELTKWLGASDVAGMTSYTRPVDARAFRRGPLRRIPMALFTPANPLLRVIDRFRVSPIKDKPVVEPAQQFDERFSPMLQSLNERTSVAVMRDLDYYNWRYGPGSPQSDREIGIVTDDAGELNGFVVFQKSLNPDTPHRGHIFEVHTRGPQPEKTAAALLDYAANQLRKSGAWFVTYRQVSTVHSIPVEVLKSRGFIKGVEHRLLVHLRDDETLNAAYEQSNWCYMYGDSEASHGVS